MSPDRGALVDSAFVLVVTTLVLSVLDLTFDDRSYLVVGLIPTVLLLGLAWVLARNPHGPWVFVFIALLLYAPLGALVALEEPGPFLVPSFTSAAQVLAAAVTAPLEMAGTLPPVVSDGSVMVVPYAIGFLAGGGAAWLALGTRRPVAPQLPLLAGLAAVIPLGVLTPSLYQSRGVLLGAVCLLWASVRVRRADAGAAPGGSWHWLGSVAAGLVLAGTAAGVMVLVPDFDREDRVLLEPRGTGDIELDSVADPLQSDQLSDGRLLQTRGVPRKVPLHFAVLDHYDGVGWTVDGSPAATGAGSSFQRIGPKVTPVGEGREMRVQVRVFAAYGSDWLPLAGELTSLDFDETNGRTQLTEVRYNQGTFAALVPQGLTPGDHYAFTALRTSARLGPDEKPHRPTAGQRQREGRFLDVYLKPYRSGGTKLDRLRAFMGRLRTEGHVRYGGSSQTAAGLGRLFLGADPMVGTPHQYTAVVALAAARLGTPSRVVVGAFADRTGTVRRDDVESWVEVQVAGGEWRTIPQNRYLGTRGPVPPGVSPQPGQPGAAQEEADGRDRRSGARPARDSRPSAEDADSSTARILAVLVLATAVGLVAVAALLVPAAKLLRRARRRRSSSWTGRYVGGWQEVVDAARDRGTPLPEHLGRVQQARLLGRGLDLARAADAVVFAAAPPDPADADRFWAETDALRRSLLAELPWRRRLLAVLSPASLMTSWTRLRSPAPQPSERVLVGGSPRHR